MSKTDLKAAMESLQVKKPLRLPAQAPAFRAPPAPPSKDVLSNKDFNLSTDTSTPQDASASKDETKIANDSSKSIASSQALSPSWDQSASQERSKGQDITPSVDQSVTGDSAASLDAPSTTVHRVSQPRRATEQDKAVTEATSVKARLSTGYTRVPNSILMEIVSGDLSRNEIKLLMLVARMTISFNRPLVPLSKGVIERMTGVQGRAVLEAVQTLEKAGLLRKIPGDHNNPNRLGLIHEDLFSKSTDAKAPQDKTGTRDESHATDQKLPVGSGAISPHKKDSSETIDLRKKISLSNLSDDLRAYFSNLKPRRKRESEFQAFESLKDDFADSQISACLEYLARNGSPRDGAAIHSPMSFLASAMSEVLPLALADTEKRQRVQNQAKQHAETEERRRKQEQEDDRVAAERECAFNLAFPTPQSQLHLIEQYAGRYPMLGKSSLVLRKLAIAAWYSEREGR